MPAGPPARLRIPNSVHAAQAWLPSTPAAVPAASDAAVPQQEVQRLGKVLKQVLDTAVEVIATTGHAPPPRNTIAVFLSPAANGFFQSGFRLIAQHSTLNCFAFIDC